MPQLSIIIVNYKNPHLIFQCVQSIVEHERIIDYEIIVVDNNSNDNSQMQIKSNFPSVKWIQLDYNSGFGRANNIGLKYAYGEYVLFMNSDVIVTKDNVLCKCMNGLQNLQDDNVVLGTNLCNKDGSYQETIRLRFPMIKDRLRANAVYIFFINRLLGRFPQEEEKKEQFDAHGKSSFVAWINGAFLLVKREILLSKEIFFDNDIFLYGEDIEWCWFAQKKGVRFYHYSETQLVHLGSASMPQNFLKRAQIIVSDWIMIRKCYGHLYLFVCLLIEFINLVLDSFLYRFAKLRNVELSDVVIRETKFRSKYYYLIRKYGLMILVCKNLSSSKVFKTNCYDDAILQEI